MRNTAVFVYSGGLILLYIQDLKNKLMAEQAPRALLQALARAASGIKSP